MTGERNQAKAGYRYHVFAYFPCNSGGVRVTRADRFVLSKCDAPKAPTCSAGDPGVAGGRGRASTSAREIVRWSILASQHHNEGA